MIPVYDFITGQIIYVNVHHCVYTSLHKKDNPNTRTLYDVYLTSDVMIRVCFEDFSNIKKELE